MGDNKSNLVKNVYEKNTQTQLASFLHATCFSPVESTLIKAFNKVNCTIWTGLAE